MNHNGPLVYLYPNGLFLFHGGLGIPRIDPVVAPRQLGIDRRLRPADGGYKMNILHLIAGAITLALLVYLILALLKPEWFG
jgi:K+-transporting ATPase KdpF subunit